MKKLFYLSTCDTCKRIMKALDLPEDMILQDIKKEPISRDELSSLRQHVNSYEDLLNKRARLYKERDLKNKTLTENDIKDLITENYTLLKRPVIVDQTAVFIGNSKKTKDELKIHFNSSDL